MSLKRKYIDFRMNLTRFRKRVYNNSRWKLRSTLLMYKTIVRKECYFGPFTGEFGHLLGHNLPFIAYLNSRGVKVHFSGMEIHRPFFVNEEGKEIVETFLPIRDFFTQALPNCNTATGPDDVITITNKFISNAKKSGLPYWDNSEFDYYFDYFRWWILKKGMLKVYDLSKVYGTAKTNSIVLFPRKMNMRVQKETQLSNNGEQWDYYQIAKLASRSFDKVYVIGHPSFSDVTFDSFDNVVVNITNNNGLILSLCSNAKLIVTQHSGSVYLGEYTNTPVLIIYKGGNVIGNMEVTKQFKSALGNKHEFKYAFSYEEISSFFKSISDEKIRN